MGFPGQRLLSDHLQHFFKFCVLLVPLNMKCKGSPRVLGVLSVVIRVLMKNSLSLCSHLGKGQKILSDDNPSFRNF
ncbi:MAG: hypothetical protein Ct9H300mP21_04080 [Pseudomonadota bacterium]|nr:MAG: hypothetical protein Ct9H300mP21_04080 [Pseudomonadota bacterium]